MKERRPVLVCVHKIGQSYLVVLQKKILKIKESKIKERDTQKEDERKLD